MRVHPDQSLAEAQSLMSANDFSQLPVMTGPRDLRGAVSWRSIAQAKRHKAQITLADATENASIVSAGDELLSQIDAIYKADFVFVRDDDDRICGIVTTADLTDQFRDLTTPFFQLGEIERRLRRCIDRAFSTDDLRAATGNKKVGSADDLTFGQYVRLLSDESRWQRMDWEWADCKTFIGYLDAARVVRNRVMHFGEELSPEDKRHARPMPQLHARAGPTAVRPQPGGLTQLRMAYHSQHHFLWVATHAHFAVLRGGRHAPGFPCPATRRRRASRRRRTAYRPGNVSTPLMRRASSGTGGR